MTADESPVPGIWFTDLSAALDALEVLRDFLRAAETNRQRLRWAIVAAHQATQSFMISTLAGTDGTGVLTKRGSKAKKESVQRYKEALWGGQHPPPDPPKNALASFMELYEFLQDDSEGSPMRRYVNSHGYVPGEQDSARMERLNQLRNGFIHFEPGGWFIKPAYAVEALVGAYAVLKFTIEDCPLIAWYPSELQGTATALLHEVDEYIERLCAKHGVSR